MIEARKNHGLVFVKDKIFAVGGQNGLGIYLMLIHCSAFSMSLLIFSYLKLLKCFLKSKYKHLSHTSLHLLL